MAAWSRRPEGSNWGDFGVDDQVGRLNLITAERRLAAVKEVREGLCFNLSLPLDLPGPGVQPDFRQPPQLSSTLANHNFPVGELFGIGQVPDTVNDDRVLLCTQYSTQWDSLAHIGCAFDADADGLAEILYYNGFSAREHIVNADENGRPAAKALGIEQMSATGVQGRGALIDFYRIYGEEKHSIGYDELMRAIEVQKVDVRPGDLLCTHTGYGDMVLGKGRDIDPHRLHNSFIDLNGSDDKLLQWITDSEIAAICSDTMSIESHPLQKDGCSRRHDDAPLLGLHHHCLFKLGVYLGEFWYFGELARWLAGRDRSAFLLTAPPLRLPGAVGSPVTPVATV